MADITYRLVIEGENASIKAVKNVDIAVDELTKTVDGSNDALSKFDRKLDDAADGATKLDDKVDKLSDELETSAKQTKTFSERLDSMRASAVVAATKLGDISQRAISLGQTLTMSVTAPLVAMGGAAIKLASDFEASMTQIQTLVGLSAEQVSAFRSQVLALSGETARGPKELADALFVVTSAGIRGAEALEILDASAKASAIGLGETKDIGRALTAVLQAYAGTGLTAAQATDQLVAIVREGNLEASSLAPTLGRVIGIAANMGVSFAEVGANVATFTRLGVSAEQAITGIAGVLRAALKPASEQGKEALAAMGLEATYLRDTIKEKGLAGALVDLMTRFKDNTDALSFIIPEIEAFSSVLGVAGAQAETYLQVEKNIIGANGLLAEGFEVVSNTAQFKLNKALTSMKTAGVDLGVSLLPVLDSMTSAVQSAAGWFTQLDEKQMNFLINVGKLAVVVGPAILVLGKLGAAASAFGLKMGLATGGITLLVGAIAAIGTALYLQEGGFEAFADFAKATVKLVTSYFADLPKNMLAMAELMWDVLKAPFDFMVILARDIASQIVDVFKDIPRALLMAVQGDTEGAFALLADNFKSFGETMSDTWAQTLENLNDRTFEFSDEFKLAAVDVATTATTLGAKVREAFTFDIAGSGNEQIIAAQDQANKTLESMAEEMTAAYDNLDAQSQAQRKKSTDAYLSDLMTRTYAKREEVALFTKLEQFKMDTIAETDAVIEYSTERYVESNMDRKKSMKDAVRDIANAAMREMKVYLALTIATAVRKAFTSSKNPIAGAIMGAVAAAAVTSLFSQIPQFEKGGLVKGDRQLIEINEKGQEFVVNAESTRAAMPLLQAINENPQKAREISDKMNDVSTSDRIYEIREEKTDESVSDMLENYAQTSDRRSSVSRVDSRAERATDALTRAREAREIESLRQIMQTSSLDSKMIERALMSVTTTSETGSVASSILESMLSSITSTTTSRERDQRVSTRESDSSAQRTSTIVATREEREDPEQYAERRASQIREVRAPIDSYVQKQDDEEELDVFEQIRRAFFDREPESTSRVTSGNDVFTTAGSSDAEQENDFDRIRSSDDAFRARESDSTSRAVDRYLQVSSANEANDRAQTMNIVVEVVGKIENEVIRIANERATQITRSF